jgi:toxin ParE1/3/4
MASRRYRISRRARADLDSIASYLAAASSIAARRVLLELEATFQSLARDPEIGTRRHDLHPNIRIFVPSRPASNYVVFYYPCPDGIEISDVVHAARDWIGMFSTGER